jgi:hypothetical protein
MPVPRHRDDDAYFAPLRDLDIGEAKLYLGLVHHTDGVEGARRRLATARKYITGFGIATECGFGRRPPRPSQNSCGFIVKSRRRWREVEKPQGVSGSSETSGIMVLCRPPYAGALLREGF